ncbi:uncharacterized protein LOC125945481 [Dermacentor silvarum]|uniref:uncharacterized protein LOC125945481 n=1 Tax=Dermacentor silvarum TaxID=543639 RepID=UPI0021012F74|nr:uncharacterized protein LOC125945481 [Dermacentor silvarum]
MVLGALLTKGHASVALDGFQNQGRYLADSIPGVLHRPINLWRLLHEFPRYCVAVYDVERDDFEHICPRESAPLLRVVRKLVTATGAVLGRVTTPSPLGPWPSSMRIKSQAWGPERCVGGCSGVEDSGGGGGSPNTPRR